MTTRTGKVESIDGEDVIVRVWERQPLADNPHHYVKTGILLRAKPNSIPLEEFVAGAWIEVEYAAGCYHTIGLQR